MTRNRRFLGRELFQVVREKMLICMIWKNTEQMTTWNRKGMCGMYCVLTFFCAGYFTHKTKNIAPLRFLRRRTEERGSLFFFRCQPPKKKKKILGEQTQNCFFKMVLRRHFPPLPGSSKNMLSRLPFAGS